MLVVQSTQRLYPLGRGSKIFF